MGFLTAVPQVATGGKEKIVQLFLHPDVPSIGHPPSTQPISFLSHTWLASTGAPLQSVPAATVAQYPQFPTCREKKHFVNGFRTRRHAVPTHTFHDSCTRRLRFLLFRITRARVRGSALTLFCISCLFPARSLENFLLLLCCLE